jgi:hypothetical protein
MSRLNVLAAEPWDEQHDHLLMRRRGSGAPLGADSLGASLTEFLPGSQHGRLHIQSNDGEGRT